MTTSRSSSSCLRSIASPASSSPSKTSASKPSGACRTPRPTGSGDIVISHPRSKDTSTFEPTASVSASTMFGRRCSTTPADPPPTMLGCAAFGPMIASRLRFDTSSGRVPSLVRSTIASAAARRINATCSGRVGPGLASGVGRSRAPTRSKADRSRRNASSRSASGTSPASTALTSVAPNARPGPGISRSSPAARDVVVSATANQSVITSPWKPHSSRRSPMRYADCSVSHFPFRRL